MIPAATPGYRIGYLRELYRAVLSESLFHEHHLLWCSFEGLSGRIPGGRTLPCWNGKLALQIAYRVLGVSGKAITPFTFAAATSSSLRWRVSSRSMQTSMHRA